MTQPVQLAHSSRGAFVENVHLGHVVISDLQGVVESWGDPQQVVLPRSSAKMIQALPLVASGAARAFGLGSDRLALACASHEGAPLHVSSVEHWLRDLGLSTGDLLCGPQPSRDKSLKMQMIREDQPPCALHHNCSGKHAGFLTLTRHLQAGPDYVAPDHPVQRAVLEAFETVTGAPSPGFGIDGCSAPNFAASLADMARAMAWFATAQGRQDGLSQAAARLVQAMMAHPDLVAGDGRACTALMRAAQEPVAVKTGADGYFVAILPQRGLGVALKIADGSTAAANCAITAILARLGVVDPDTPALARYLTPPVRTSCGAQVGALRPDPALLALGTGPQAQDSGVQDFGARDFGAQRSGAQRRPGAFST